jgi:hypothetical protein
MTPHDDDRFDAMALLERANPIDHDNGLGFAELGAAHAHVRALLDSQIPAPDGPGPTGPLRGRGRRRPGARLGLGVAALAAAALAAVLVLTSSAGPEVPSAAAMTIKRATEALRTTPATILHVDFSLTSSYPDGHSWTVREDSWQQQGPVCNFLLLHQRDPGTPPGTIGGTVNGKDELYDPVRNTIYVAPGVRNWAGLPTECSFMARFADQVRGLLRSHQARIAGHATVDGKDTIKIVFASGGNTYYVAADGTYAPVELVHGRRTDKTGLSTTVFHTYERLPASGHSDLLSLTARHPTAAVKNSLAGYRSAINRLFPDG